jgi:Ser/Thr protein kinase RdoA (MazF antagonist)
VDHDVERVLRLYPDDCQPRAFEPLAAGLGFSGAALWRVETARGSLCLRRWPPGHPTVERLEFIQAVLWHVDQEGFRRIPMPLETRHRHGYVFFAGHLWELAPWLAGRADFPQNPSTARLESAMISLAQFHLAASTFPLPDTRPATSPGIDERRRRLADLVSGRLDAIRVASSNGASPALALAARHLVELAARAAPRVAPLVESAAAVLVPLQPCIRDIWSAHVLFTGDVVSGIVDFGAMRVESVAADVARLLGSLVGDDAGQWQQGLAAYQRLRGLSDDELRLVSVFDRSTVLLGGLQWLDWIYLEGREFPDPPAVMSRIDEFSKRLAVLAHGTL